jgi:tryptophanyl-tRNA synthetase
VPVGEDQVPHVELTREVARRFNHLYGREPGSEAKALEAAKKLGNSNMKQLLALRNRFHEQGDAVALEQARTLLAEAKSVGAKDRERLYAYLEGSRKIILNEPNALLTEASKMPGLDGAKMSKSYHNTLSLRESPDNVAQKVRKMPTDPARVRRTDVGDPDKCPVWKLHQVYSDEQQKAWVQQGCRSAGIGCLECKEPVIQAINQELEPMRERAAMYSDNPGLVRQVIEDGSERARLCAQETMRDVRQSMGLAYAP